jgi:hypothetical protein
VQAQPATPPAPSAQKAPSNAVPPSAPYQQPSAQTGQYPQQASAHPGSPAPPGAQYGGQAAARPGAYYTREQLRRLIEEKRQKRKKLILIGIPGVIVIGCIVALILIFFVFGGGLSPEEYNRQAVEIHKEVLAELKNIELDWDSSAVSEEPFSWWYGKLCTDVDEGLTVLSTSSSSLNELKPPQESASLHEELVSYCQSVEEYMLRAETVFAFAKEWARIWEGWLDTPYAMDRIQENSTPAEAVALIDEDIAIIDDFVSQFNSLACPDNCQNMMDSTVSMLEEEKGLMERFKRALINIDINAYDAVLSDYEYYDNTIEDRIIKLWDDLDAFRNEFWDLVDEGENLEDRLDGPANNKGDEQVV